MDLVIDLGQAADIKNLRPDLLDGILKERNRLKRLDKINPLEFEALQPGLSDDHHYCSRENCCSSVGEDYEPIGRPMTHKQGLATEKVVEACRQVNIAVDVVEDEDIACNGTLRSVDYETKWNLIRAQVL